MKYILLLLVAFSCQIFAGETLAEKKAKAQTKEFKRERVVLRHQDILKAVDRTLVRAFERATSPSEANKAAKRYTYHLDMIVKTMRITEEKDPIAMQYVVYAKTVLHQMKSNKKYNLDKMHEISNSFKMKPFKIPATSSKPNKK